MFRIYAFILICTLSQINTSEAQVLKRSVFLGLATTTLNDSLKKINSTEEGLLITSVSPNSTASDTEIKPGDILLSVNGYKPAAPSSLVTFLRDYYAGDLLTIVYVRDGREYKLDCRAKSRPDELTPGKRVIYDEVSYSGGTLRMIVHIPEVNAAKHPVLFFLQGYPCSSQDYGSVPDHPVKKLLDDFVRAGYVTVKVDRPNTGDSRTKKNCPDINYDEEYAVNKAAYEKMLSYDFTDTANVFLFGHSLGSVTAPLLAAKVHQPSGVIVYGAIFRSWFEYFIDIFREQPRLFGATELECETETREMIPLLHAWLEKRMTNDQLLADTSLAKLLPVPGNQLGFDGKYFFGRSSEFWQDINKQRLASDWSLVKCKVLAVYGEFDIEAISDRDARKIAAAVNEANPGAGTFMLIPGADHAFLKAESYKQIAEVKSSPGFWAYALKNYNPAVAEMITGWIKGIK